MLAGLEEFGSSVIRQAGEELGVAGAFEYHNLENALTSLDYSLVPSVGFETPNLETAGIETGEIRPLTEILSTEQLQHFQEGLEDLTNNINEEVAGLDDDLETLEGDDVTLPEIEQPQQPIIEQPEVEQPVAEQEAPEIEQPQERITEQPQVEEPTPEQLQEAKENIEETADEVLRERVLPTVREQIRNDPALRNSFERVVNDIHNIVRQSVVDGSADAIARRIGERGRELWDWLWDKFWGFWKALLKVLGIIGGTIVGYNAEESLRANYNARRRRQREKKEMREEIIKEIENDLGTNSGTMNPEVRKNFGKESFFETSQGDLHYSEEDNILVVSYRGTDFSRLFDRPDLALIDIVNDLNMGTRQYMGLSLHAGFLDMFLESLPEIKEFINQYMDNDTIVYTTGHSAGSPSAVLLAYTINQHRGNHNCICYTFGSPRFVIEGKSAERINSVVPHHFRINTDNDLVPYLPPRIKPNPIPQYIHVGTEYVFSSEGGGYGINKEDTRTVRNLKDLGHILYKIMFLYTGAGNYVLSDGSSLLGRLIDAKKLLNPITFFQEVSRTGKSILFNLDLIENPFVDRSRYNFRSSPMRTSRALREQMGLAIDRIKEGFKNSWGDKLDKINSILYRSTDRFIFQLDQEAYELAWDLTGDAFKTSRQTLRIKTLMVRAGIPETAVDNYLTSIFDVTYNRGRNFKQTLIDYYGTKIGNAIANTFGNYLTFRTFMINCGFATGLALVFNFFIQGQYDRFLGHRIVNYDKILSTFTDGKMELGHPIKSENEIIGNNDVKTSDGIYKRTNKKHFNKTVYESDGMNFTPHFHRGEIYMNHLPSNMSDAIMGYYLYKPEEFGDGPIKGFVVY